MAKLAEGRLVESGVFGVADPAFAASPAPIEGVEEADVVFWGGR